MMVEMCLLWLTYLGQDSDSETMSAENVVL